MTETERDQAIAQNLAEWAEKRRYYEALNPAPLADEQKRQAEKIERLEHWWYDEERQINRRLRALEKAELQQRKWMKDYNERVPQGFWERLRWLLVGRR